MIQVLMENLLKVIATFFGICQELRYPPISKVAKIDTIYNESRTSISKSPDHNPIENIWDVIDKMVWRRDPSNVRQYSKL